MWDQFDLVEPGELGSFEDAVWRHLEEVIVSDVSFVGDMEPEHSKIFDLRLSLGQVVPHVDVLELSLWLVGRIGNVRDQNVAVIFQILFAL
jgi:hypothetical protein